MTRIVAISDTHCKHRELVIPDGDILIHAGDFTMRGTQEELIDFNDWLGSLPHLVKLVTPGNHDFIAQDYPGLTQLYLTNAQLLIDQYVETHGLKIYMSPWTPEFFNWAFMKPRDQMQSVWDNIPGNTDILVTHGPPRGILDLTIKEGEHVGCEALRNTILGVAPKVHICGHIHEAYGPGTLGDTKVYNVSTCNRKYKPVNLPVVIDI